MTKDSRFKTLDYFPALRGPQGPTNEVSEFIEDPSRAEISTLTSPSTGDILSSPKGSGTFFVSFDELKRVAELLACPARRGSTRPSHDNHNARPFSANGTGECAGTRQRRGVRFSFIPQRGEPPTKTAIKL